MCNRDYKAFIVEGEAREPLIIGNISKVFFQHGNFKIITLPAGENIYMLWKKLKEDDFSEVYLFFDYDAHQTNLGKADDEDIVVQMLESFDNETENGKLYISYPMVEALRDFESGVCEKKEECFVGIKDLIGYKNLSASRSFNPHFKEYNIEIWKNIIDVFAMRVTCLFGRTDIFEYEQYSNMVSPYAIQLLEENEAKKERVFILSAFPEFLIDYFGIKLWKTCVKHRKNQLETHLCKKE